MFVIDNETNFKYNSLDESQIQVVNAIINTLNKNIAEFNTTENLTVEHILMLGQAVNVINKQARDVIFTLKNERKENIATKWHDNKNYSIIKLNRCYCKRI